MAHEHDEAPDESLSLSPMRRLGFWIWLIHRLWALGMLVMAVMAGIDYQQGVLGHDDEGHWISFEARHEALANLCFNVWGLLAGSYLALLKANPFNWVAQFHLKGISRLALGLFCIAVLLGRPFGEALNGIGGWVAALWDGFGLVLVAVVSPVVMMFGAFVTYLRPGERSPCRVSLAPIAAAGCRSAGDGAGPMRL